MTWQLLIIGHLIATTSFSLLFRYLSPIHANSQRAVAFVMFTFMYGVSAIYSLSTGDIRWDLFIELLPWMSPMLVLGPALFLLTFTALKSIDAGQFSILYSFRVIVTSFLAVTILGEKILPIEFLGGILVLVSIFIVAPQKFDKNFWKLDYHSLAALAAGIVLGLAQPIEKYVISQSNAPTHLFFMLGFGFIGMLIMTIPERKKLASVLTYKPFLTISAGFMRALSALLFVLAIPLAPISILSAVSSSGVVLVVLAGAVFLHERSSFIRTFIGSLLAFAGLLLVGLF